jgi:hypothetical protein
MGFTIGPREPNLWEAISISSFGNYSSKPERTLGLRRPSCLRDSSVRNHLFRNTSEESAGLTLSNSVM